MKGGTKRGSSHGAAAPGFGRGTLKGGAFPIAVLACLVQTLHAQEPAQWSLLLQDAAAVAGSAQSTPQAPDAVWELVLQHDGTGWRPGGWCGSADTGNPYRARVLEAVLQGDVLRARVRLFLYNRWGDARREGRVPEPGGLVREFTIEARRTGEGLAGTWRCAGAGRQHEGPLKGTVTPCPSPPGSDVPAGVGEHPQLLIRKSEVPELRRKAQTEWGRKMLERLKKDDPYKTNMAVGRALLYVLTQEQTYADEARDLLLEDLDGRGWHPIGPVHDPARKAVEACLAYDLIYDVCDQAFRERMRAQLAEHVERLYRFSYVVRPNGNDASNWSALYRAGCGVAALALAAEPGVCFADPPAPALPRLAPPADLQVGKDVPVVRLESGKMSTKWLSAGPLKLRPGQDGLLGLGGAAKARPENGTPVSGEGPKGPFKGAFRPAPERLITQNSHNAPEWMIGFMALGGSFSTHYFYAVMDVERSGWRRVDLNEYQLENPCVFIAGRRFVHGDCLHLEAGKYPVMACIPTLCPVMSNSHDRNYLCFRFRLFDAEEADALAWFKMRAEWHAAMLEDLKHRRQYCAATGRPDPEAEFWLEAARRRVEAWTRLAQGTFGFNSEGEAYNQHSFRCVLPFAHAYQRARGVSLSAAPNLGLTLPGYAGRTIFRENGAVMHSNTNGGGPLGVDSYARGFALVPTNLRPAVFWAWQRTQALADAGTLANPWLTVHELDPMSAVFMFVNWPLDAPRTGPEQLLPKVMVDEQKGGYVFRNRWRDGDDCVTTVLLNRPQRGARNSTYFGAFELSGLGTDWVVRGRESSDGLSANRLCIPGGGPAESPAAQLVHFQPLADGSGTLSMRLDECYPGHTVLRACAVDYSGKSGAGLLFAVVDQVSGPLSGKAVWQMVVERDRTVDVAGNVVTIKGAGGFSLYATVIAPPAPKIEKLDEEHRFEANYLGTHRGVSFPRTVVRVSGGDAFFILMAASRTAVPVNPSGRTLTDAVTIGKQSVRFDGRKIVFGVSPSDER
jgi:hypothetical protein